MNFQLWNRVENNVAKEDIAYYEQFQISPQCFQKLSATEVSDSVFMWEIV